MADEAAKAEGTGAAGEVEELPTMPPAPRRGQTALRWATPGPVPGAGHEAGRRPPPEPGKALASAREVLTAPVRDEPTSPVLVPRRPPPAARAGPGRGGADAGSGGDVDAGPGPGPGAGEPGGRSGQRRRVTALLVLVGSLLALAGVAGVIVWRVGEANVSPPRTTVTVPGKPSPEALFESLLATSATAHQLAQTAVDGPCRTAAPQSAARAGLLAQIAEADTLHRYVLQGVQADQAALARMPAGRALAVDLQRATDASVRADAAYRAWLEDLQATGCYSAPANDLHYRAATAASVAAGRAKEQLALRWAGIASRFHLRSWRAGDL